MPVDVGVQINDREVTEALERTRLALPLGGDMLPVMKALGRVLRSGAQLRFREEKSPEGVPWKASFRAKNEAGQTLSATRRLRNSITERADRTKVEVGTNVAYAVAHQFGARIRAKKGPFLAIPVTPAARSAGSPRNFPGGLHVAQSLRGQFMLMDQSGVVQYLLRRQIILPARPFLGASGSDRAELLRVMTDFVDRAWSRR